MLGHAENSFFMVLYALIYKNIFTNTFSKYIMIQKIKTMLYYEKKVYANFSFK